MRRFVGLLLVLVGVSGCSFSPLVRRAAVDYNRTLEESQNATLLLNVVRGAKRQPFYYTALSKLTGNVKGSIGLDAEFPHGSPTILKPSLSLEGGTGSFDVAPLDTQDFIRGIMKPMEVPLFAYYWQQGWPHDLLLHAAVARIEVRWKREGCVESFANYPGDHCAFSRYDALVRCLTSDGVKMGIASNDATETIAESRSCDSRIILAGLKKDDLKVKGKAGLCTLVRPKTGYNLCFGSACAKPAPGLEPSKRHVTDHDVPVDDRVRSSIGTQASVPKASEPPPKSTCSEIDSTKLPDACSAIQSADSVTLFLRSPEAVMYYLGEIERESEALRRDDVCRELPPSAIAPDPASFASCKNRTVAFRVPSIKTRIDDHDRYLPMFAVQKRGGFLSARGKDKTDPAVLEVRYEGDAYRIPASDGTCRNQSLHALSLVNQLIGLQKSVKDLPSQETITVLPIQ